MYPLFIHFAVFPSYPIATLLLSPEIYNIFKDMFWEINGKNTYAYQWLPLHADIPYTMLAYQMPLSNIQYISNAANWAYLKWLLFNIYHVWYAMEEENTNFIFKCSPSLAMTRHIDPGCGSQACHMLLNDEHTPSIHAANL
jgi:hypothetical protein